MPEPGSIYNNTFGGPVGQVIQADQVVVNEAAAPSQAPFFANLRRIDRVAQIEHLAEVLDTARGARRPKPLVVVLTGVAEDDALSFVQRLGEHSLAAELGAPCDYLGSLDWPERSFHRLVSQLNSLISTARRIEIPNSAVAQDSLAQLVAGHDRSIAFAHELDPEVCKSRPEILQGWSDMMTTACGNPAGGFLIAFLCLRLRDPRQGACRWLAKRIAELAVRHDWCLLDELRSVTAGDVTRWIERYNEQPALGSLQYINPDVATGIFSAGDSLRYRHARQAILTALAADLSPQKPRWAA